MNVSFKAGSSMPVHHCVPQQRSADEQSSQMEREQQEGGVEWVVGKPEQRDSSQSREGKRKGET